MSELVLETPDGPMPAALAEPTGLPKGGVVVLQEGFGLTPHIVDITRRLAEAGWLAVAPALYHRQGSPVFDYDDRERMAPVFQQVEKTRLEMDVRAALAEVADRGFPRERTGIVGFCMGGTIAFHAAAHLPVGAAVTFYGGGVAEGRFGLSSLIDAAPELRVPWLGLYGDQDGTIPVEQVEALRAATDRLAVDTEVVRYPEADHGFNCNDRSSFHAASAADAWTRTLDWFGRHLG